MRRISLNDDWTVRPLSREGAASRVSVPHDAMLGEPRTPDSPGGDHIGWYAGGDYEYVKTLFAPEAWAGMKAVIEFEGVYHNAEVTINGEKAAFRPYGYTGFCVKADPLLRYGADNVIRVVARNADQPNSRWYTGTGIYRPVSLWLGGEDHIRLNGVRVRTLNHETGEIEVLVRASRPGEIRVEILDGGVVAARRTHVAQKRSVVFRMTVPDARLWEPGHPNLYTCRATFGDDVAEETFGIRALRWSHAGGLTLNGNRLLLKGACVHHDNGLLGACAFPEAEERKVRLLKACGFNALRSAHNPCSKALLDACDRLGMLVVDEYADCWYLRKTPYDYAKSLDDWWQDDLNELVNKDFNHPSVILYSIGNDVAETAQPRGIRLAGDMTRYLHSLDDSRPVTCAIDPRHNLLSTKGAEPYSEDRRQNRLVERFAGRLSTLSPGDWKTQDAWAELDIAGYNHGLRRFRKDLRDYPDRLILGTELDLEDMWRLMELAKDHPRVVGGFVWGMDHIGGANEGAAECGDYRLPNREDRMTRGIGCLDITGAPRAEAAYARTVLGDETNLVIVVRPVGSDGTAQRALASWAWNGCEGRPAEVEVYARAAGVELRLNGVAVARAGVGRDCRARFRVPWQPGTLSAHALDDSGAETGTCALISASDVTELRLFPEVERAEPGGLCYVRVRYTDENGVWKPLSRQRVAATVENGTLIALGGGCAYIHGNYNAPAMDTYYGEALAILRAGEAGTLALNVIDDDGRVARVELPVAHRDTPGQS